MVMINIRFIDTIRLMPWVLCLVFICAYIIIAPACLRLACVLRLTSCRNLGPSTGVFERDFAMGLKELLFPGTPDFIRS